MKHQLKITAEYTLTGSLGLYLMARAGFVKQGTTLNKWCIANGLNRQTAEKALKGVNVSRRSLELVKQIAEAALPQGDGNR